MTKERRWRLVALLATGMLIGVALVATPAGAHVGGTVHHLWGHLKPKADKRYLPGANLPPGKTMKGTFMLGYTAASAGSFAEAAYTFQQQLASAPAVHYIPLGFAPPPQCPGTDDHPQAKPGHLCIYESSTTNVSGRSVLDPTTNTGGSSRWGFMIQLSSGTGAFFYSNGTWAVTAHN